MTWKVVSERPLCWQRGLGKGVTQNMGKQVARHHWHVEEVRMFFCLMLPVS